TASGFNRKRKRRNIEEEHIFDVALENATLNASADRDYFVRVYSLVRFLADKVACNLLHLGHARHAAHQHELVDLLLRDACVLQASLHRRNGALEQIITKLFHLRAAPLLLNVLLAARVRRDKRQIDFVLLRGSKRYLGF